MIQTIWCPTTWPISCFCYTRCGWGFNINTNNVTRTDTYKRYTSSTIVTILVFRLFDKKAQKSIWVNAVLKQFVWISLFLEIVFLLFRFCEDFTKKTQYIDYRIGLEKMAKRTQLSPTRFHWTLTTKVQTKTICFRLVSLGGSTYLLFILILSTFQLMNQYYSLW